MKNHFTKIFTGIFIAVFVTAFGMVSVFAAGDTPAKLQGGGVAPATRVLTHVEIVFGQARASQNRLIIASKEKELDAEGMKANFGSALNELKNLRNKILKDNGLQDKDKGAALKVLLNGVATAQGQCLNSLSDCGITQKEFDNLRAEIERQKNQAEGTSSENWITEGLKAISGGILGVLTTIFQLITLFFGAVIKFLEGGIAYVYGQAYILPPYIFDIWKKFAGISLSLVVLLGAIAAFMITAHSAKEEDARVVISNIVKVVVAIAMSWTLSVVVLEQAQRLEVAIYGIAAPGTVYIANSDGSITLKLEHFVNVLQLDKANLLSPSSTSAIGVFENAGRNFDFSGTIGSQAAICIRSLAQMFILLFAVVPLMMILFAYVARMVAMYILLPVASLAALGLFSPKIHKLFDQWFEKFFTVVKMPVVLAVFIVVAGIFVDKMTTSVAKAANYDPDMNFITMIFGVFGSGTEDIFKNLIVYIAVVMLLIKGVEEAMSNEMTKDAVGWGKTAGGYVKNAMMTVATLPVVSPFH